nr:hypothetical protein [Paraburkholderia silviterrae]
MRPHINRNVASNLGRDILDACRYLEEHGGNATPPALHGHTHLKGSPAKC